MNTLQSTNTRTWLLVPVLAVFAAYAQAASAANSFEDTQSQVRAVLQGGPSVDAGRPTAILAPSRVTDIQESTRQILMGTSNASPSAQVTAGGPHATARAGHGDADMQIQAQRTVLGRAAS